MKIERGANTRGCIRLYRYIEVLEKSFNAYVTETIVPVIISITPAIQISAMFVCIKMHGEIALPGFSTFPLITLVAGITNVLVLTLAPMVNTSSRRVLDTLEEKIVECQGGKRALNRKEFRACSVLKIKFGSNFIDRGTPLIMQNFCVSQTVSLCLVKAR